MSDDRKPVTVAAGRDNRRERRIARKSPALSGGTTAQWLAEFGFIRTTDAPPLDIEKMPKTR